MTTRVFAVVFPLAVLLSSSVSATGVSKPIVDVRFDGPYRQIEKSRGDEWAPTWGRDDVLYTGNDDGNSFGGVPLNVIAFGKLEGRAPDALHASTISGMPEYRERPLIGPEGAVWRARDSLEIDAVHYRIVACGVEVNGSPYSCLVHSRDGGETWANVSEKGRPLFRGTRFSAPTLIAYREYQLGLFGNHADEYIYAAAYAGIHDGEDGYLIGRVPKDRLAAGDTRDWDFRQKKGGWAADLSAAQVSANSTFVGPDRANWKTTNTYSVDGVLYMFVMRCVYPWMSDDPSRRHVWTNSSIIKSGDGGKSWVRPAMENFNQPMFPGTRFGTPYFVWYGKDGAASVDNADRYVYAVSSNGYFENGDDYVIGRVLRSKLSELSAADWSFYIEGDGMKDKNWTLKLDEARPIFTNPGRSSMTGMTYIQSLRRYVLVSWHYNQKNFEAGIKAKDVSTVLQFYEAPKPWGPWTLVKSLETGTLGWYTPIIGQRFQTPLNADATQVYLYATGFFSKPEGGLDPSLYKLNYLPITLSAKPLEHKDPTYVGGRE